MLFLAFPALPAMTQDECLTSPHHFTHLGVCYPGTNANINISSPQDPQPATFTVTSVPEPSTSALFAVALIVGAVVRLRRRRQRIQQFPAPRKCQPDQSG